MAWSHYKCTADFLTLHRECEGETCLCASCSVREYPQLRICRAQHSTSASSVAKTSPTNASSVCRTAKLMMPRAAFAHFASSVAKTSRDPASRMCYASTPSAPPCLRERIFRASASPSFSAHLHPITNLRVTRQDMLSFGVWKNPQVTTPAPSGRQGSSPAMAA